MYALYNDGQIESGFPGKIIFEICNSGNFPVKLLPHIKVAQLFLFKPSSKERYMMENIIIRMYQLFINNELYGGVSICFSNRRVLEINDL